MAETFTFPPKTYAQEDIQRIMASIRKGNSAVIIGLSGSGKSTLARLLADARHQVWREHLADTGKTYHFIHLDYSFNPHFQEVMRQISWELTKQGLSLPPANDDSFAALDAWLTDKNLSNQHIVLIFDGYDDVDAGQARPLLNRLRRLRNRQMNMSFLFVCRREPHTLYEIEELVDALYYLSPLNARDQRLTISRHERRLGRTFTSQQKEWLTTFCGGYPGFMKYMSDLLYDHKIEDENQVISTCLADRRIKQICRDIWSDLSDNEKNRLIEVANAQPVNDDSLSEQLKTKHLLNPQGQIQAAIFKGFICNLPEAQPRWCIWQLRPPYLIITAHGREHRLELARKEGQLLTLLMQKAPASITLDEFRQALWPERLPHPDGGVDSQSIARTISRLRLKVDQAMRQLLTVQETAIKNVRGQGYHLDSRIQVKW